MMNKKAEEDLFMSNVLDVLLAIIVLGLIIFFIVFIYRHVTDQETENAKNSLNSIEKKINALGNGENTKLVIQGFQGASNWYLVGFGKDDAVKPDKCYFDACICVCPLADNINYFTGRSATSKTDSITEEGVNICQASGFCRNLDTQAIKVQRKSFIDNSGFGTIVSRNIPDWTSKLAGDGGIPEYREDTYVRLYSNLIEVSVSKNTEGKLIIVKHDNPNKLVAYQDISIKGFWDGVGFTDPN